MYQWTTRAISWDTGAEQTQDAEALSPEIQAAIQAATSKATSLPQFNRALRNRAELDTFVATAGLLQGHELQVRSPQAGQVQNYVYGVLVPSSSSELPVPNEADTEEN